MKSVVLACRYRVRVAVVDLDKPPAWWEGASARSHLTANDARQLAGTTGKKLLELSSLPVAQDIVDFSHVLTSWSFFGQMRCSWRVDVH